MRLLIFVESGVDVRVPPERDPRSGRIREDRLVREIDPGSAAALELALRLKAGPQRCEIVAVHVGAPDAEPWLRRILAAGADRAVRIWDEDAAGARAAGKAVVLSAAASVLGFDLALAGAAGVIEAGGQLGVLVAAYSGTPCVTQAVDVMLPAEHGAVQVLRSLDRGFGERVEATLPLVVTVAAGPGAAARAPAAGAVTANALLEAQSRDILVWDLADLGVSREAVAAADQALAYGPPRPRRPRLHHVVAPEPELPAFDRILELVHGQVERREGRLVRGDPPAIVDDLFETLLHGGWLHHLRPDVSSAVGAGPGGPAAGSANRGGPAAGDRGGGFDPDSGRAAARGGRTTGGFENSGSGGAAP